MRSTAEDGVRILWLAHRDPESPRAGGAERTIHEVGRRLASRGHEVVLVTAGWRGSRPRTVLDGIEVRRYPGNLGAHLALPSVLMREEFDAAVCDLGHAMPWPSAPLLMRERCAVFFRHLHARTLWGQVNPVLAAALSTAERAYPMIYRDEAFVTESKSSRDDLIRLGVDPRKITLIPPGVDHDLFRPGPKTPFPSIVYFGGMRRYKRPRDALLAFALVRREIPDARLYVVGEGPELPGLRELTKRLGIEEGVEFTGRLGYGELAELVSSAWLNIHTSAAEGWGYSITEAAAAGTPTVAYDVPGVSDAVEEGRNGIRVRDGDARTLAEAALRILRDPDGWWRSSPEVAAKYSWDRTAYMWEGILRRIPEHASGRTRNLMKRGADHGCQSILDKIIEECNICHGQRTSRVERDLLCERAPYGIVALGGSPRREDPGSVVAVYRAAERPPIGVRDHEVGVEARADYHIVVRASGEGTFSASTAPNTLIGWCAALPSRTATVTFPDGLAPIAYRQEPGTRRSCSSRNAGVAEDFDPEDPAEVKRGDFPSLNGLHTVLLLGQDAGLR